MHLDSLYGGNHAVPNLGTINVTQTHSLINSTEGLPEGASRLQMLHQLVTRMNHFMETCFGKLVSLCISKQQEK